MTEKDETLRLADALGNLEATGHCSDSVSLTDRSEAIADAAAAELRRLSAVEAQRDALLEALKKMRIKYGEYACSVCDQADAAIKAVEETK